MNGLELKGLLVIFSLGLSFCSDSSAAFFGNSFAATQLPSKAGASSTLEVSAFLLPVAAVFEASRGCGGLFSCFRRVLSRRASSQSAEGYHIESLNEEEVLPLLAAEGDDDPDPHGSGNRKSPDYEELRAELKRILAIIEQMLQEANWLLLLCLDIDGTVLYNDPPSGLHSLYFNQWREHIWRLRRSGNLLLIYNTSRPVGSLSLMNWQEPYPDPDVLILDGLSVQFSPLLHLPNLTLPGVQGGRRWRERMGRNSGMAVADSYLSLIYSGCPDSDTAHSEMQQYANERFGVWHCPGRAGRRGVVLGYDRLATKGQALVRVVNHLQQYDRFGANQAVLITAGDNVPDMSMMTANMNFPFDEQSEAGAESLPDSVNFLGSVIAGGGELQSNSALQAQLSGENIVGATEASIRGILRSVLQLLEQARGSNP